MKDGMIVKSILDNQYTVEELNQICKEAQSQSEAENRKYLEIG